MSHGRQWRFLPPSRTIHGTSCCCESHYNTKDPTENLFTRVSSSRAQAGHTHTRVPSLVYQASSSVCAGWLLLSLSPQLLTSPLSTVTTKSSELFLKVWTKRPELNFCCCLWSHTHRPPAVHSQTVWCILRTIQKISSYCKTAGPQSSFRNLFQYDSSSIQLLEHDNEQLN